MRHRFQVVYEAVCALQWGRDLVIAEIACMVDTWFGGRLASMGPRSGDRGNASDVRALRAISRGFNGAAIW